MMNFMVKTSLGILLLVIVVNADVEKSNRNFNEQCQALKCNPSTEICRRNLKCDDSNQNGLSKCVYCALKTTPDQNSVSKTLLASSISQHDQPLAPRLLATSSDNNDGAATKLLADNHNKTSDELTYDDYYEYDDDNTSDKDDFGEEDEYLDDYAESSDSFIKGSQPIRKLGVCPKVLDTNEICDLSKPIQSDCRFDTDCSGDQKCCESTCGKRICNLPITTSVSVCPSSFTCTLNCRLGYKTDSNGCLLCECQSCPSMDQCNKNCPSGYLKDLFGCDICECSDQCPPFSCGLVCPKDVGFAKNSNGCPLCQCATSKTKPIEYTSSCQDDVHCPPGFRCLNDARNVPMCQAVSEPVKSCPLYKCKDNCGDGNYKLDENGCRTCECKTSKSSNIECSPVMCRMYCVHGFRRDENGCEICQCNDSPQPCPSLSCLKTCTSGYKKDYSGCPTCTCKIEEPKVDDGCSPMTKCSLNCSYGFERDPIGCPLCSCNRCPLRTCRMFCMYGFKKNSDGCDICECDWTPVSENIPCSERTPCEGNRVCNLNLKLCELVDADKVNWFIYNFDIKTDLFGNKKFVNAFKSGLISNIAAKYDLETTQIIVSSVEKNGMTSFQIMPFYNENLDDFQKKMDQIDIDLNSYEFRTVIPSVVQSTDKDMNKPSGSRLGQYTRQHPVYTLYIAGVLIGITALTIAGIFVFIFRQRIRHPGRSESKSPICDTSYHPAPTEDDHYRAVHAPDGTAYVVVETDDVQSTNDKRALV